jgi:hypothetical protein
MFHSKKSDAIADVLCDCPEIKQEDTCLFCWYPAVGAYRREWNLVNEGYC